MDILDYGVPFSVLVTGGRNFYNELAVSNAISSLQHEPDIIIQGGATGADALAKSYAINNGIHCAEVKALWGRFGKRAGPIRNVAMLHLRPSLCIAFPGGKGTESMISACVLKSVPVIKCDQNGEVIK